MSFLDFIPNSICVVLDLSDVSFVPSLNKNGLREFLICYMYSIKFHLKENSAPSMIVVY